MKPKRLSKTLASAGIASRRKCEELIFQKRVKVNSITVEKPQTLIDEKRDIISLDDKVISPEQKKVYYLLNKPVGYHCTHLKQEAKKTIFDLFADQNYRLFSAGRLDKDASGLIIITNDGHFAHRVIHPSSNIEKEYIVEVKQSILPYHLITIAQGMTIEGRHIQPTHLKMLKKNRLSITVKEGKKHEIRIFIKKAKLTLIKLQRIRIGSLELGSLPPGKYRIMSPREKRLIFQPYEKS